MKKKIGLLVLLLAVAALFAACTGSNGKAYSVTYELNGGTNNAANPGSYVKGTEEIVLKDPDKPGYDFAGWAEGDTIPAGSTGDKIFTAQWTAAVSTVTYDYQKADTATPVSAALTYGLTFTLAVTGSDGISIKAWDKTGGKTLYAFWSGTPGLSYTEISGADAYSVSKGTANTTGDIYIQDYFAGKPVTGIADSAFRQCYGLTGVTIPDSVTAIGELAFYDCSLESLAFPNDLITVEYAAFSGCSGLTELALPAKVRNIGQYAFDDCRSLAKITVDEGNAYYRGEGNCLIESSTNKLLLGCSKSVIPEGVTEIVAQAFRSCNELSEIILPDSLTSIGASAFAFCTGLTGITIPDGVVRIGNGAFAYCEGIVNITIPKSVAIIEEFAFAGCFGLESITVAAQNQVFKSQGNCLMQIEGNVLILGCKNSMIPPGTIKIGDYAFYMCKYLSDIVIPAGVTSIGKSAFAECYALTEVNLPNTVSALGESAFRSCRTLTSVSIWRTAASGVTTFGADAFSGCTLLAAMYVPLDSLTAYRNAYPAHATIINVKSI